MNLNLFDKYSDRYPISSNTSKRELHKILKHENLSIIQFVDPIENVQVFKNIESVILKEKPNIELRAFGHYGKVCDLKFLEHVPSLKKFSADCLMDAINLESINELLKLEELSIGIFNLTDFNFLNKITPEIKSLFIGRTASKKPNVSAISRFFELKYLYLEGHNKGIQEISKLSKLEEIVLRSISTENLDFLKNLQKLWSVDIKLGGIKNFDALAEIRGVKYLELWQVRNLMDISFISRMTDLQNIFLQSLPNVEELPNFEKNKKLRRIGLENLKGLKKINSLEFVEKLDEFFFFDCSQLQPEDFIPLFKNKNLKYASVYFGSDKSNDQFKKLLIEYRKLEYKRKKFNYIS
ncbi:hypothetical protein [Aureibaculum conchae]|uniref:hypothetical protein n=1 Tax=Aureibaculum sp. 2308TA14-22 TaxID=3108392 RepID=UPI003392E591